MTEKQKKEIGTMIGEIPYLSDVIDNISDYVDSEIARVLVNVCEFGEILSEFDLEIVSKKE